MKSYTQEPPGAASPQKKRAERMIVIKSPSAKTVERCRVEDIKLDSTDLLVIDSLSAAFQNGISTALLDVCLQRRILPTLIGNALNMVPFLCGWMRAAKIAERATSIRFSVLIAEAWYAPHPPNLGSRHNFLYNCFGVPHGSFVTLEECLLDHAQRLAETPKFRGVMCAMKNRKECLRQIGLCELWDEDGREDRVDFIVVNNLQDCDSAIPDLALDGGKRA